MPDLLSDNRIVELAEQVCSIPSTLPDDGDLAVFVADSLERSGVDVHYQEVVPGRANVIATVHGAGRRPPLVLNGHLDASVHPGQWEGDPYRPRNAGGRLYAGGISDMKGAVAAMMAVVEAAGHVRELPGDLIFQAVMHHDGTGLGAKYALAAEGPREGFAICGEPSDLVIHTSNGGAVKFEITITGRTAHVCRAEDGLDAIAVGIEVYQSLSKRGFRYVSHPRLPDLPRMVIGQFDAGSSPAHVAEHAVIRGDVRTVPGMGRATVTSELRSMIDEILPAGVTGRARVISAHQPFLGATSGPLVDSISQAHALVRGSAARVTNELPGQAYVTDAADLVAAGLETVVYGPGQWRHAPNESLLVRDLIDAAHVYLAVAIDDDLGRQT